MFDVLWFLSAECYNQFFELYFRHTNLASRRVEPMDYFSQQSVLAHLLAQENKSQHNFSTIKTQNLFLKTTMLILHTLLLFLINFEREFFVCLVRSRRQVWPPFFGAFIKSTIPPKSFSYLWHSRISSYQWHSNFHFPPSLN